MPTQTRTPQSPLSPPPATASSPAAHRGHHTLSSSSSSSSSSLLTVSSAASSPSPSPRSRGTTSRSTTSVPFSWEHHPGIPKTRFPADAASPPTPLPLPPPLRAPPSGHRGDRRRASPPDAADPFAAALAECTRDRSSAGADAGLMGSLFPAPASASSRRWSIAAAGGVVGFLDLYGCKSAMAVAEGAFIVRRPVAVARPGPGRAGQGRPGRAGRR
ncbi:uncharacterized protein LOC133887139 [Phragmites australis]|uniref:uncharacterized protein LOC133887139 n=1 Tax=Phragmites australis TaxID=29695 RepID=UPI002D770FC7|nr:uncharacterized protein LOC133887139 [Phragmites australis]